MQKILEELWYGNLCPIENYRESCEQMSDLVEYIKKHRKDMKETMTDEQKAIFEKLDDCQREYASFAEEAIFVYAFRLGARIITETLLPPIGEDR